MDSRSYQFDPIKGYGIRAGYMVKDRLSRKGKFYPTEAQAVKAFEDSSEKAEALMKTGNICEVCNEEPALITNAKGKSCCIGCY